MFSSAEFSFQSNFRYRDGMCWNTIYYCCSSGLTISASVKVSKPCKGFNPLSCVLHIINIMVCWSGVYHTLISCQHFSLESKQKHYLFDNYFGAIRSRLYPTFHAEGQCLVWIDSLILHSIMTSWRSPIFPIWMV